MKSQIARENKKQNWKEIVLTFTWLFHDSRSSIYFEKYNFRSLQWFLGTYPPVRVQYMSSYINSLPWLVGETAGQFDLKLKSVALCSLALVIFLHLVWFSLCSSLFWEYYCETMESWTICNFDTKVPLVKFIFKNKGWFTRLQNKINNKMEILLPMEGGVGVGGGNKRTTVKQVSVVNLFDLILKHLNYSFIDFWN